MNGKTFRTLGEQIEIFESKGLTVNNKKEAQMILFKENYFFVNGYRFLLMKSEEKREFVEGSTFEELYSLFMFDRNIRNVFFKNLLIIENNIKSIISYQLSRKYGYKEVDYLNPKNFNNSPDKKRQVKDLINKMKRQIRANGKQHRATFHYISNYGYIPLWVLVKVLSFGIVSELYSVLKYEDQKEIANYYKLTVDELSRYLCILANYRNLCAHEDILFDNRTLLKINDTVYHSNFNIEKNEGEYVKGKNDLFSLVIILKLMLGENDFKRMMDEFIFEKENLNNILKSININKVYNEMGFPENFEEIKNM